MKGKIDLFNPEEYYFVSPGLAHSDEMKITESYSKVEDYTVTADNSDNHGKLLGDTAPTSIGKFSISTYGTKVLLILRQGNIYLAQSEIIVGDGVLDTHQVNIIA